MGQMITNALCAAVAKAVGKDEKNVRQSAKVGSDLFIWTGQDKPPAAIWEDTLLRQYLTDVWVQNGFCNLSFSDAWLYQALIDWKGYYPSGKLGTAPAVVKEYSKTDPVFYYFYTQRRIDRLETLLLAEEYTVREALSLLTGVYERCLMRQLAFLPLTAERALASSSGNRLLDALRGICQAYDAFYLHCPLRVQDRDLAGARLYLTLTVRDVLGKYRQTLGLADCIQI